MDTTEINADRGEVGLTLAGRVYPMLPTFAAVNAIESKLGPVASLLGRYVGKSDLTFQQLGVIAAECIKAAGRDRSDEMLARVGAERVGELIYSEGLTNHTLKAFLEILTNMCTGGMTPKKAIAAEAATEAAPTSASTTEP